MNCTPATRVTRFVFLLLSCVLLAFAGCTLPPRLNHMYSSGNATKASGASTSFDGVASTNSGITAKMIATIGSDGTLMQTTDTLRERLRETSFGDRVENKTWISLRAEMWKDFGLIDTNQQQQFDSLTYPTDFKSLEALAEATEKQVPVHISQRTNKVETIAKILEVLAEGQAALVKNAADQASTALTNLQTLTNKTSLTVSNLSTLKTNHVTVADMLQFLQTALITAGSQTATNEMIQTNATALQKLILSQAESSRDPASAYALVALVGSGLGTNDLLLLDTYLANLQLVLSNELQTVKPPPKKMAAGGAKAGPETEEAPTNAVKRFIVYSYAKPELPAGLKGGGPGASAASLVNLVSLGRRDLLPTYEDKFTKSYSQTFKLLASLPGSAVAKSDAAQKLGLPPLGGGTLPERPSDVSLQTILTNLPAAVNDLISAAKDLQINVSSIQDLLNNTNAVNLFTSAIRQISGGNLDGTNVINTIMNAALLDPTVAKFFNQNLPTNVVDALSGIAKDITSQENAAGARLLSFFIQLSQTQTSIYQENARHYTVLGAISTREVQRWSWIGEVYERNSELSSNMTDASWASALTNISSRPPPVLFLETNVVESFADLYNGRAGQLGQTNRGYTNYWSPSTTFPAVHVTDRALPSLQLLAETAKKLQQGPPSQMDPIGLRNEIAQARLNQGIEILLNSDFILNYNVRQADSLNRMLVAEMKQHSVTLDGLELQPEEANIRLQLGNSVAFHSTGITDADIQSLVTALQTGALGYISAKQ